MPYRNPLSPSGPEVLALFQEELERTAALPGLAVAGPALWPRFARYFQGLTRLPRRLRRALQRRWRRSLGGIALLCALGQAPALAATIAVDGTTCTLIDAISSANSDAPTGGCRAGSGADTLVLSSQSTHTLVTVNNSTNGLTGLPVITSELTIEGNDSTITRDSALEFRILAVGATGNLTLQNTRISGGAVTEGRGEGGGIDNAGILALSNVEVERNTAYVGGGINNSGSLTFDCCSILSNTAAKGAGIRNFYFGTMVLTNVAVQGNVARYGTGGASNYGTLTLSASIVSGNTGSTGGIGNVGTLTVSDSTVEGNTVDGSGGGVNSASSLTLTNSTISGNTAADRGGGVYNRETLTLTNSTISRNASGRLGGGLFNQGELTLVQSLISGNTAPVNGPEAYSIGSQSGGTVVTTDGFNLFGHDGSSGALGFTLGATDLVPGVPVSAILDPTLAYNGGPSGLRTHTLVFGSPAVDAVPGAACATAADQRRAPRPQDGDGDNVADCDIGAVERGVIAVQAAITSTTLECRSAGCRVSVRCNLQEAQCTNQIDVAVRPPAVPKLMAVIAAKTTRESRPSLPPMRAGDGALVKASKRIRFATGASNIPPGGTQEMSLKLTKSGRQLVRTTKKKQLKGRLAIKEIAATVTNTSVTISDTEVTLRLKRR